MSACQLVSGMSVLFKKCLLPSRRIRKMGMAGRVGKEHRMQLEMEVVARYSNCELQSEMCLGITQYAKTKTKKKKQETEVYILQDGR